MELRPIKRSGMLTFAGIVLVIAGSFNLLMTWAGFQVIKRKEAGLGLGIGIAGLSMFTQLMFLKVHLVGRSRSWSST